MLMVTHTTDSLTEYIYGNSEDDVRSQKDAFISKVASEGAYIEDLPPKIVKLRTNEYATIVRYKKKIIS